MNYQMSAMEESTFKKLMAEQMHTDESALDGMTIEQIGASMGVELKTFEKETQNEGRKYDDSHLCGYERSAAGDGIRRHAGKRPAFINARGTQLDARCHGQFACQIDGRGVRGRLRCGGRRGCRSNSEVLSVESRFENGGMALIMGIATVLVGFIGARIGAGIGRDLRGKIFKRVVSFSNAEMDRFQQLR